MTDTSPDAAHRAAVAAAADEAASPRPSMLAALALLDPRPGWRVLDAGCGSGAHLGLLADRVGESGAVVGVDSDSASLSVAAELWADPIAAGRITLREADLTHLALDVPPLDLVWSTAVFHHLTDPVAALAAIARHVRPGGTVAVLDGDDGLSFPMLPWPPALELRLREAVVRGAAERYGGALPYHYDGFLGRRLPALLRQTGLRGIDVRVVADVDRGPLPPGRAAEVRGWFLESFGVRVRPYLAPADWDRLAELLDPDADGNLLTSPDLFLSRGWLLVTGRTPS